MRCLPIPFLAATLASAVALAVQVPHAGFLLDADDRPITAASASFTFAIHTEATSGTPLWTSGPCALDVRRGYYATTLGDGCGASVPASALPVGAARFVEVTFESRTLGPRLLVPTVPTAGVTAETQALRTALAASGGTPLVHWDKLSSMPASLANGDQDTTYTASGGLALLGTQVAVQGLAGAATGSLLTRAAGGGAGWTTAGTGLALSGGTLSAAPYTGGAGVTVASNAASLTGLASVPASALVASTGASGLTGLAAGAGVTVSGGTITSAPVLPASPTFTGTTTLDTLAFPASGALRVPQRATVPASCTSGQVFFVTGTDQFYACRAGVPEPIAGAASTVQLGDPTMPAPSCNAIRLARPTAPSAVYSLSINGSTVSATCDMSIDGGGWTRTASLAIPVAARWSNAALVPLVTELATPPAATQALVRLDLDSQYGWVALDLAAAPLSTLYLKLDSLVQTTFAAGRFGVNTTTGAAAGTVWFNRWSNCYSVGAGASVYNVRNNVPGGAFCYGQFAFATSTQTIFAYSNFSDTASNDDVGLGSRPTSHPDWTFAYNAGAYTTRRLTWYVR